MGLSDLTRFVQFVCALGLFGFAAWQQLQRWGGVDRDSSVLPVRWVLAIYTAGCLLGAAGTVGWLCAEAQLLAGDWRAVGAVIASTRFGAVAVLRAALLLVSAPIVWVRRARGDAPWGILGALTAAAMVSFVWTGHGTAGAGTASGLHMLADVVHLCCAALWFGALIMLSGAAMRALAMKNRVSSEELLAALSRFSAVGPALVGLLIATGGVNTWLLVGPGHWRELVQEPYGRILFIKIALFGCMLALAFQHRYRSTPRLRHALACSGAGENTVGFLRQTLMVEAILAILVLAAVALLGNLQPPASLP